MSNDNDLSKPNSEERSMDQVFIDRLHHIIDQHLLDAKFGIEDLGKEIGMSRSQIHRKLQAISGQSPSHYIRSYKLEQAKSLLIKQVGTIAEISDRFGFSSPTYFGQVFSEEFGYPPSQAKQMQEKEKDEFSIKPFDLFDHIRQSLVARVIAIYLLSGLVLMQIVINIFPILDLTRFHQKWVLYILALGFLIVLIYTWAYQLKPPARIYRHRNMIVWSINGIVLCSGLFTGYSLFGISQTDTVKALDEFGNEQTYHIPKEEFVSRIHIFTPFTSKDTSHKVWLGAALPTGLYIDLKQFNYVSAAMSEVATTTSLNEKRMKAIDYGSEFFCDGSFSYLNNRINISLRLIRTSNLEVIKTGSFQFSNVMNAGDSLSIALRDWLDIDPVIIKRTLDLPLRETLTKSDSAYKYYLEGNYPHAIKIDSSFAYAAIKTAIKYFVYQQANEGKTYIELALKYKERLWSDEERYALALYQVIHNNIDKANQIIDNQLLLTPDNLNMLDLKLKYYSIWKDDYIDILSKIEDIRPITKPEMFKIIRFHLIKKQYQLAIQEIQRFIDLHPDTHDWSYHLGQAHMAAEDYPNAKKYFERHLLNYPKDPYIKEILLALDYRQQTPTQELDFILSHWQGTFEYVSNPLKITISRIDNFFYVQGDSQHEYGGFCFLKSKDELIGYGYEYDGIGEFFKFNALKDHRGTIYAHKSTEIKGGYENSSLLWRVDTLIEKAISKLGNFEYDQAKVLFQQALTRNPHHFFIEEYLQHIDFMTNVKFVQERLLFDSSIGNYQNEDQTLNRTIEYDNGQYYWKRKEFSFDSPLYPLSTSTFKVHNQNNFILKVIYQNQKAAEVQAWFLDIDSLTYNQHRVSLQKQ